MKKTAIEQLFSERQCRYANVAFVDLQGQLRGKTVLAEKLLSGFPGGMPFSPQSLLLDFGDHVLFPRNYLSTDQAIGDEPCRVDWERPRTLPFEDRDSNLLFFTEFADNTKGSLWDPRSLYRRVAAKATGMGFTPVQAFEYEFRVFNETPRSLREKNYQAPDLLNHVSTYGGVMHQGVWADFFKDLRRMCDTMEVKLASQHWEVAASMAEVALHHQSGIDVLDDAVLFKTHAKALAARHNLMVTFMARPFADADGQSGHVHLSMMDKSGNSVFFDPDAPGTFSQTGRHFLGGVVKLLPELLLMSAPNINSFKRFVPGIFTPTFANWGFENRTAALRVIGGTPGSQRIEFRVPGSDSNPYLVASALLASGLWGITNEVDPGEPITGSSYRRASKASPDSLFPESFLHAIHRFHTSAHARELFGEDFVEAFAGTRAAQAEAFSQMVTSQELERFLELA